MAPPITLVYPGTDGKRIYIADSLGNKIPDFSNAAYKAEACQFQKWRLKKTKKSLM